MRSHCVQIVNTALGVKTRNFIFTFLNNLPMLSAKRYLLIFTIALSGILNCHASNLVPDSILVKLRNVSDTQKINILNDYVNTIYTSEFEKSKTIADSILKWAEKLNFKSGVARSQKMLSTILYFKGDYENALAYSIKSAKIYEALGDKRGQAIVYNDLANMLRKHNELDRAKKYLQEAMQISRSLNDKEGIANAANNIGVVYEYEQNADSALHYYQLGLQMYTEINSLAGMGYSYNYIGVLYAETQKYEQAVQYLEKSIAIREKIGDVQPIAVTYENLGEMALAQKDIRTAKSYFQKSLAIATKIGMPDLTSYIYKMLADVAAGEKEYAAAFNYQKQYEIINDSLFNVKRNAQIADMQIRYETEKKEKENAVLLRTNKEKELRITKQRVQLAVMSGILLISILSGFLFYSRNKLRQQELLNEEINHQEKLRLKAVINSQEKERTRISAELHDGLGQVLSAARLNLAAMEGNAVEGPQLQKALGLIDRSCKELREISHDMMPSLLMKAGLVAAAKELIEGIKQGGKVDVGLDVELMEERLPADIELNLFRVLQELLTNIYKYAKATEVQIQIIREEKGITMMVEDNGVGFDPEHLKSSSGNGWYNIQSRVRLMGGEYEIDSRIDSGSVITVSVPL